MDIGRFDTGAAVRQSDTEVNVCQVTSSGQFGRGFANKKEMEETGRKEETNVTSREKRG